MRGIVTAVMVMLFTLGAPARAMLAPREVVFTMSADRFDISAEGNAVTGLRWAPVPYESMAMLATAVRQPAPVPAAVRVTRSAPPQVIDYVWCVTDEGVLVVGQQVRTLDVHSGQYAFTEGDIKRAYPALEASVPWKWIVDIPLGREIALTLEVRATTSRWPVRSVTVVPSVSP